MTVLLTLEIRQDNHADDAPWYEFKEGVKFVLNNRLFLTLILLSWISMFFGTSYVQIMPLFADMLQSGEQGFGLLISATGVGSIIGNLFISRYQLSRKLGKMMLSSAAMAETIVKTAMPRKSVSTMFSPLFINLNFYVLINLRFHL